jgi:tRNA1(Val) A37 N6-methylase TrmN6
MTARGAIHMIRERQLNGLNILDICCGVGIVGLTVFVNLRKAEIIKAAAFADINIFNLNSLHKTLKKNHLENLIGNQIRSYLSDGLKHIPQKEQFDLIISNPPHYFGKERIKDKKSLSPGRLGTFDAGWDFHRAFYQRCHHYLSEKGEVWFLENSSAAGEEDFLPFIVANDQLTYRGKVEESSDPRFFWMITQKS